MPRGKSKTPFHKTFGGKRYTRWEPYPGGSYHFDKKSAYNLAADYRKTSWIRARVVNDEPHGYVVYFRVVKKRRRR